jgi:hypothetical protein
LSEGGRRTNCSGEEETIINAEVLGLSDSDVYSKRCEDQCNDGKEDEEDLEAIGPV